MAVTIIKKAKELVQAVAQSIAQPKPLPWEEIDPPPQKEQNILQALNAFDGSRQLFLVHKQSKDEFEVVFWDKTTQRAELIGPHKMRINPLVTEREVERYTPVWR